MVLQVIDRCISGEPDLSSILEVDGWTIEDATRDASELYIYVYPQPGLLTIEEAMATYPTVFKNITVTTDANLDNAPSAGTDATLANMMSNYAPVNDSLSVCQGSHLTTATSAGASSTTLSVADAKWFHDPSDGTPSQGVFSAGHRIHIAGVGNVVYTAINYLTNTITLATAQSWSNGAAVNMPITNGCGSSPSRGIYN